MESIGLALQPRALGGRGNRDWFSGITAMGAGWDGGAGGGGGSWEYCVLDMTFALWGPPWDT